MSDIVIVATDRDSSKQRSVDTLELNVTASNGENKTFDSGIKCQVNLGTGNTECCVQNCSTNFLSSNNKSQITFVTFPKDPSRFTEWTRAIGRQDLTCYIGKKDATNLLVCSKHFSQDMWVNSNTRLKRLHKSAVPEISSDDEIDILEVSPEVQKLSTPTKKGGGLKIKKVSSLLTESALKETLSSPAMDTSVSILTSNSFKDANNKPNKILVRKFQPLVQRQKQTGSTELEKKLLSENGQLKAELDKNMDYILNQKAHYEGILSKEKRKNEELENKIEVLENAQRKLWHTYESQLQAQRTVNTKELGRKELATRMKHLESTNDSFEKKLAEANKKIIALQSTNASLETALEELTREESSTIQASPPPEPDFTGENFKTFLDLYLRREKILQERIDALTGELETHETPEGRETRLLNLASQRLNHVQLAWLEMLLKGEDSAKEFQEHIRELCLSLHEASEDAYAVLAKTLGLPSSTKVQEWAQLGGDSIPTANNTINALFEEEPTPSSTDSLERLVRKARDSGERERSPPLKRKCLTEDVEDEEEGRASDEEEEIIFSEDSEEEESVECGGEKSREPPQQVFEVGVTTTTVTEAPPQPDFAFILEEEEVTTQQDEDDSNSAQVGSSMPLLVPDSPINPIHNIEVTSQPQPHQPLPPPIEPKISNRKKVITSDSSLPSGAKVVFRVIES